ncbi:hypothetical protein GGP62_002157 [Salinibacter ruber]|uniref:hypothetical protein n=1 Tax=Salinibacter ruber TaxID=146919 RepID=UPI0021699AFC|nr:hypothetical protein [Salinibacter ruber]MCS3707170.1 hypothetical protein [Salinibacter ruber]
MRIHPPEAGTEVFTEQEAVETLESFDLAEAAESPVGTFYVGDGVGFLHVGSARFGDVIYAVRFLQKDGSLVNIDAVKELLWKLTTEQPVRCDPPAYTALFEYIFDEQPVGESERELGEALNYYRREVEMKAVLEAVE